MKKISLLVLSALVLSSCAMVTNIDEAYQKTVSIKMQNAKASWHKQMSRSEIQRDKWLTTEEVIKGQSKKPEIISSAVNEMRKKGISSSEACKAAFEFKRTYSGSSGGKNYKLREKHIQETDSGPLPLFVSSKALQPFINEAFGDMDLLPIEYFDGDKLNRGYSAVILPKVCEVWLKAKDAGALQISQFPKAKKAEILMRGLAHVGIVALVDEATGYQDSREKDALAKILEKFVAKELQAWVKTFPIEYYKELCRLYGVPFPPERNNQFPQFFGHVTNNAIYSRIAPELLPELKKAATKQEKKAKLHQLLTVEIGHPKLREHLASIVTLLKLSQNKEQFFEMVDRIHPKFDESYTLDF